MTRTGPNTPLQQGAIHATTEDVAFNPRLIHVVFRINLDTRIDNRHRFNPVPRKSISHAFRIWIGILSGIPGETPEAIHVVNIDIDGIAGNFQGLKSAGNFHHLIFTLIRPLALVKPQSPQRRKLGHSRESGIRRHDVRDFRPVHEIKIHLTSLSPKTRHTRTLFPKIETGTKGIVEENSVGPIMMKTNEERNVFIKRICGSIIAIHVTPPKHATLPTKIFVPRHIAQTIEAFARLDISAEYDVLPTKVLIVIPMKSLLVLTQDEAIVILHSNKQSHLPDQNHERFRFQNELFLPFLHLKLHPGLVQIFFDCVGKLVAKLPLRRKAKPDRLGVDRDHFQLTPVVAYKEIAPLNFSHRDDLPREVFACIFRHPGFDVIVFLEGWFHLRRTLGQHPHFIH